MPHTYNEVQRAFGEALGRRLLGPHPWNPTSNHPRGRACNFTVGHLGQLPNPTERATGWQRAHLLQANADPKPNCCSLYAARNCSYR